MTFLNPWAWIGLAAVVVPIVAHLLARRPARRQPFPTIRLLPVERLTPVRRGRPTDWLLLVIRCAIVIAAVAALARPLWLSRTRAQAAERQITRAIIVDASLSMDRSTASGERGVEAARREAARLAAESTRARIEESAAPAARIEAALNWLSSQATRRELVVISDFQRSTWLAADFSRVPDDIGRRLVTIELDGPVPPPANGVDAESLIRFLGDDTEKRDGAALRAAALATGAPAMVRGDRPVAFVFPGAANREAVLRSATPIGDGWMFDIAQRVTDDAVVRAAVDRAGLAMAAAIRFVSLRLDGRDTLALVLATPAHSLVAAAALTAATRAIALDLPATETDPSAMPLDQLRSLQRAPLAPPPDRTSTPDDWSDGRWFWAASLALILIETLVRRSKRRPSDELSHARVA